LGHPILDMAQDFCKSTFDSIDICNLLPYQPNIFNTTATTIIQQGGAESAEHQFHRLSRTQSKQQEVEESQQNNNFRFTCHNVVKDGPIPFESDTFDYVQQTLTTLAYKKEDWTNVLQELKRVTKPGGYIQLIEVDLYTQPLGEQGGLWRDQSKVFFLLEEKNRSN
jgi:SAM-dependent methyltransferase